ncbi:hypothetical protein [Balnearium lithotrophicum]|uniref:hypothetical protein n=1 Tax=Balnearium lithotrophicum TaxID=223788 RepID=UPI00115C6118|nr:hypothetical protein [Balnearium lithotrophicum]
MGSVLLLLAVQTLYCRGTGKLKVLLHITTGLSLLTLIFTPIFWKSKTFYLYPQSYVEVEGKKIGLIKLLVNKDKINSEFFIEEKGKRILGRVSFNKPLFSSSGMLWIKGLSFYKGLPMVKVQYSNFSLVPFLFLLLYGLTTCIIILVILI